MIYYAQFSIYCLILNCVRYYRFSVYTTNMLRSADIFIHEIALIALISDIISHVHPANIGRYFIKMLALAISRRLGPLTTDTFN